MELLIGSHSSWSLRTLLCMKIAGITPQLIVFDLNSDESQQELKRVSPTGRVPVVTDNGLVVHDSLAIAEYLNEIKPGLLYSASTRLRAEERSLCAELHSGFSAIRRTMPFVACGDIAPVTLSAETEKEITRINAVFDTAQGDFFRGHTPGAVDAFYSVMAYRLASYGICFAGRAGDYQHALTEWSFFGTALSGLCLPAGRAGE